METPAPRIGLQVNVGVTFEGARTSVQAVSQNVSVTGVLLRSPVAGDPGSVARLEFDGFEARAEVTWSRKMATGFLVGMRFLPMEWGDRDALIRLLGLAGDGP